MSFAANDKVRVFPHGSPDMVAQGQVVMVSNDQRMIAVGLKRGCPFAPSSPTATVAGAPFEYMLVARRVELNGQPWGPWVEPGGGHFEVEHER